MTKILQIGLGNFGKNHFRAWHELGFGDQLVVAELNPALHQSAATVRFPAERICTDPARYWAEAEILDVVTGTDTHFELCERALSDGKDVFVEKPLTPTSGEAAQLVETVARTGRLLQVGFYYRYHPLSVWVRDLIRSGALGSIRYLKGEFFGFKRARNDIGVMHTDGIHFIDLFNWLLDTMPARVFGVVRDHFGRGLEDFAIALMTYPDGVVANVEAGYIQPGEWRDKVVAGAMTTKRITVVGSTATAVVDFEVETARLHDVHHELQNGVWTAVQGDGIVPVVSTAAPLDQIKAELTDFLACVETRRRPSANEVQSGLGLAHIMEGIYESGRTGRSVDLSLARAAV